MKIGEILWKPDRVDHLARHNISPEEVEEAVFAASYVSVEVLKKADNSPNDKIYRCLAVTEAGRYITFIFIYKGGGTAFPITARDMTDTERRYYLGKKR